MAMLADDGDDDGNESAKSECHKSHEPDWADNNVLLSDGHFPVIANCLADFDYANRGEIVDDELRTICRFRHDNLGIAASGTIIR